MRKFLSSIFKKIASKLDNVEPPVTIQVAKEDVLLEKHKEIEQSPPQAIIGTLKVRIQLSNKGATI